MKYTKENILEGIKNKINSLNTSEENKQWWIERISQYPVEIEQNILEWINNQPLTDVDCHGESVLKTMQMWDLNENDLPYILSGFTTFKEGHFRVSNHIWQTVARLNKAYD